MGDRGTMIIYKTPLPSGIEAIEKKGLGHPDAICDALAERVSAAYSRFCFENFGVIVPHTIDGLTMTEGVSKVEFGKGEMVRPVRLYVRGIFIAQFMNKKIPYMDIAKKTIYDYLDTVLPDLKAREWVRVIDCTQAYGGPKKTFAINKLVANHMYVVTASYPPTPAESGVLKIEQMLNSPSYKSGHPYVGSDNKIVLIQNGNSIDIEAYVSMLATKTPNAEALASHIETVKEDIKACATSGRVMVNDIDVYSSDDPLHDGRALTVTGSSIENSNGCATGRSLYQVYHAARIYSVIAYQISKRIYNEEHVSATVSLTSKVGWPMSMPWRTFIDLRSGQGASSVSTSQWNKVEEIAETEFAKVEEVVKALMYGKTKPY